MSLEPSSLILDPWEFLQIPKTPLVFPKKKDSFFHVKMIPDSKLDRKAILEHVRTKIYGQCAVTFPGKPVPILVPDSNLMVQKVPVPEKKEKTKIRKVIHPGRELVEAREEEPKGEKENELLEDELVEDEMKKRIKFSNDVKFIVCNDNDKQKAPGKESSEEIKDERKIEFKPLEKMTDWRKKLCNSFIAPFELDNHTWQNVNHFLIASEYRTYPLFQDLYDYEKALSIQENTKIKPDTSYEKRSFIDSFRAVRAKFEQHPDLQPILLATLDAKIEYRVNKKVKKDFLSLMWLRQLLQTKSPDYTPPNYKQDNLLENPSQKKDEEKQDDVKQDDEQDKKTTKGKEKTKGKTAKNKIPIPQTTVPLKNINYDKIIPRMEKRIMPLASYYLTNRNVFAEKIHKLFVYALQKNPPIEESGDFNLLSHQQVVRDYLNIYSPYRGILLYHGLGTGKSCTSIAIAEGLKQGSKNVFVFVPASLKNNYISQLQKCGDALYRKTQYWEFVSIVGQPQLLPLLAQALSLSTEAIEKRQGAWMVNKTKEANFSELSSEQQIDVELQIQEMILTKYKFLHYNANDLSKHIETMVSNAPSKNPFDHSVVIVDEAHNFVSVIVNHLKNKKDKNVFIKLYELFMDATNIRLVFLTGTPIINAPHEMAVLFNMLRGYVYTWTIPLQMETKMTSENIISILKKENFLLYDYIDFKNGTLTVTRNPFGFVNVYNEEKNNGGNDPKYIGMKLDDSGKMSNNTFILTLKKILLKNQISLDKNSLLKEKCLEDDQTKFQTLFLKDKEDGKQTDIQNIQILQRRILGLTSYYQIANDDLLPRFVDTDTKYHEIHVEMSDYQFLAYAKVRKQEWKRESQNKKRNALAKKNPNAALFSIPSSYRTDSRTCCNFAFPESIPKPNELMNRVAEGVEEEEDDLEDMEENLEEEGKGQEKGQEQEQEQEKEKGKQMDKKDKKRLEKEFMRETLDQLDKKKMEIFNMNALKQYSPKYLEILKQIQDTNHIGLHLVYSNFVTLEGIGLFKFALEANHFKELNIQKKNQEWELDDHWDDDIGKPKFIIYSGNQTTEERDILLKIYNGDLVNLPPKIAMKLKTVDTNNMYGNFIKVIIISEAGAEGINLMNTRYVHIMEPFWHNIRLDQVVGRARRLNSHLQLPKPLQTVQVFLYLSVMSKMQSENEQFKEIRMNDLSRLVKNKPITTDEYLYEISQMKQKIVTQFLTVIKSTAVDCKLYVKEHNKNESFVCYGHNYQQEDFNDFQSYPKLSTDVSEYQDLHNVTLKNK